MILHSIADCRAMTWICHWIKLIIFNYPTHRVSPPVSELPFSCHRSWSPVAMLKDGDQPSAIGSLHPDCFLERRLCFDSDDSGHVDYPTTKGLPWGYSRNIYCNTEGMIYRMEYTSNDSVFFGVSENGLSLPNGISTKGIL